MLHSSHTAFRSNRTLLLIRIRIRCSLRSIDGPLGYGYPHALPSGLHINGTHLRLDAYQRPATFGIPNIMSFSSIDRVPPGISLPSRVALALAHATVDANTHPQVVSFGSTGAGQDSAELAVARGVEELRMACQTDWNYFTGASFVQTLANGTAPLNGFRHYMVQDATYLEHYYRVRMQSVSKDGSLEDMTNVSEKLLKNIQSVRAARSTCTDKLGVPMEAVRDENQSEQLKASLKFYAEVARTNDWLTLNIAFLPCVWGYYDVASKLLSDPKTVRNTPYFPLWIQEMADRSRVDQYKALINSNIAKLSEAQQNEKWDGWVKNFSQACTFETKFFDLGHSPQNYKIVNDGAYKIRSYLEGNLYLVVNGSSVTAKKVDPKDPSANWTLTSSPDGYTLKNGTKFLGLSAAAPIHQGQEVSVVNKEQHWSINPGVPIGDLKSYQLLLSVGLQWVLDIDSSTSNVVVANNSQVSSQLWLLEKVA